MYEFLHRSLTGFGLLLYPSVSVTPYRFFVTRFGSILRAGPNHTSPGISIGRASILVIRTSYIWSYAIFLIHQRDFGSGNQTQDMIPVF